MDLLDAQTQYAQKKRRQRHQIQQTFDRPSNADTDETKSGFSNQPGICEQQLRSQSAEYRRRQRNDLQNQQRHSEDKQPQNRMGDPLARGLGKDRRRRDNCRDLNQRVRVKAACSATADQQRYKQNRSEEIFIPFRWPVAQDESLSMLNLCITSVPTYRKRQLSAMAAVSSFNNCMGHPAGPTEKSRLSA